MQLYIENKHFGVLSPDLLRVVNEKIRVTTAIMLYMGDTLDEECFLMRLKFKTQPLQIMLQLRKLFLSILLSTSGLQRISRLHYMSRTTMHAG